MVIHEFSPQFYHTTLGSHPPALRIRDGDSVITTTVDAWGQDSEGRRTAPRPNAQTGPFYVEGAEAGDTLAVTLDELAPNRDRGYTRLTLAENVVDPWYVRKLPENGEVVWLIDRDSWTAAPENPPESLKNLRIPLDPMVGCFGVAPANGEFISTATSGAFGGNMDYRGFRQGTTAYFPVFVEGALFYLGDGHAAQGDGEIVGTGIEISFNVKFTARVLKGKRIYWPRGEDSEFVFTCGNARPLDQALQHATTEMMRLLAEDYGLDSAAASIVLGQCVEYDVGNVFDPAYTMVCKIRKSLLASLTDG